MNQTGEVYQRVEYFPMDRITGDIYISELCLCHLFFMKIVHERY